MIVIATNAPMLARNLERLGGTRRDGVRADRLECIERIRRLYHCVLHGAFRSSQSGRHLATAQELGNDAMSSLFQAVTEATEEALYNALLMATPVSSRNST